MLADKVLHISVFQRVDVFLQYVETDDVPALLPVLPEIIRHQENPGIEGYDVRASGNVPEGFVHGLVRLFRIVRIYHYALDRGFRVMC